MHIVEDPALAEIRRGLQQLTIEERAEIAFEVAASRAAAGRPYRRWLAWVSTALDALGLLRRKAA